MAVAVFKGAGNIIMGIVLRRAANLYTGTRKCRFERKIAISKAMGASNTALTRVIMYSF